MIGSKIKKLREQKMLSKEFVAIQMEVEVSIYNKIENDLIDLKISKLNKLVEILGVRKSDIFSFQ